MASGLRPIEKAPLEGRRLLGALLQQRRAELGYTHRPAFARARLPLTPSGNLNTRLVADLEEAYRDNFPEGRLRQLAQAYLAGYASLVDVAHQRASTLTPVAPDAPALPSPAATVTRTPPITDAARRESDRPWFDPINQQLRVLARRRIDDPPGAQMFPGVPEDAEIWDNLAARGYDVDDRAWFIADLRRRADGRRDPGTRAGDSAG